MGSSLRYLDCLLLRLLSGPRVPGLRGLFFSLWFSLAQVEKKVFGEVESFVLNAHSISVHFAEGEVLVQVFLSVFVPQLGIGMQHLVHRRSGWLFGGR